MLEDDSRGLLVEVISEFCDQPWLSQLSVLSYVLTKLPPLLFYALKHVQAGAEPNLITIYGGQSYKTFMLLMRVYIIVPVDRKSVV